MSEPLDLESFKKCAKSLRNDCCELVIAEIERLRAENERLAWTKEDIGHLQVVAGYFDDRGESKAYQWLMDKIHILQQALTASAGEEVK